MTAYTLPYGHDTRTVMLPDDLPVTVIAPADVPPAADPGGVVRAVLAEPVGGVSLAGFTGVRSAAVAINDKTRPVPHDVLLPPLLAALEDVVGLPPEAITLIIATGTHPPMAPHEFGSVVPADVLARYPVICHDCDDEAALVPAGMTSRGTPVQVNRQFMAADLRIVVGNIEPHQFMGFSGGVKSAVIGLGGRALINHNHALLTDPASRLGQVDGNPARQDVEEAGRLLEVHFALNAVLNRHKRLVKAVAGAPAAVMDAGIPLARDICQVAVDGLYDLVISSPGGHPKDINVYQAQKALAHAALITKPGGAVIVLAACPEGTGSRGYERWMLAANPATPGEVVTRFQQEPFRAGPHKAFQIARDAAKVQLRFYSEMPSDLARRLLLNPVDDLQTAVDDALATLPSGGRVAVLPVANATVPQVAQTLQENA